VTLVIRPELAALLVKLFDVRLQHRQGERVERQHVLSVLGFAVRFDHLAVHDDPGYFDGERPGVQVEQVRRVKAKPLRGRCASPDTAATVRGMAAARRTGQVQATAPASSKPSSGEAEQDQGVSSAMP